MLNVTLMASMCHGSCDKVCQRPGLKNQQINQQIIQLTNQPTNQQTNQWDWDNDDGMRMACDSFSNKITIVRIEL